MSYDNTNRGALFKNDTTGKSENFPPYGGSLNIDGTEYWISAWVKDGAKGKFFSLQVKPKESRQQPAAPLAPAHDDFGDDSSIPF